MRVKVSVLLSLYLAMLNYRVTLVKMTHVNDSNSQSTDVPGVLPSEH